MFISAKTRTARAELRAARLELARTHAANPFEETDEWNAANARVIAAEARLPWWKRIDIDMTTG